jgi:transcriptional regulator with XRE-family HTH domain
MWEPDNGESGSVKEKLLNAFEDYPRVARDMGERFRIFRELIGKTLEQLAKETALTVEFLSQLESGEFIPWLVFFEYFYREYGLNLTWMTNGKEKIFFKKGPRTPGFAYELDQKLDYKDPAFTGIIALMQDTRGRYGDLDSDSNIEHTMPTNKEE